MNLIMAILIGGLVLAGWFIANQQQMLVAGQDRVNDANARLEVLEARLVATDSALSQDGVDTKQSIGLWESEIRKLWAVANERNRTWIQENQKAVKKIKGTLNGIESSARDLNAAVGRHDSAFAQQQTLVDNLTSLELQMQQILRSQRDLVDKVNKATQAVASMRSGLSGKVDDNAEAIASIDAYRVAVNSRLADMERRLGALGGASGG
jgi:chromosome segregation ATPase